MSTHEHSTSQDDFQALIPFTKHTLDNEVKETVNARDLHTNMEIGKEYRSWFRAQIKRLGLVQDIDFIPVTLKGELAQGGSYLATEYYLTIDAAKHVALASLTKKGREIRAYFIEAEKRLRHVENILDAYPELKAASQALVECAKNRQIAEKAAREAEEAKALAIRALESQDWMTLRQYVFTHKLHHQLPAEKMKEFARYLTGYCLEQGIPVSKEPVADRKWGAENRYHVGTIQQVLPAWLARYYAQADLEETA